MKERLVVKRYAEAFMDFARETIGLKQAVLDFKNLKAIMHENKGFQEILHSLDVSYAEKRDFIDKVLNADFSNEFKQFLKLLLEKNRIGIIGDIADYVRVAYSHLGETEAILRTSFPLDLSLIRKIKDKLEKKFKRAFRFYIDLDGSLLGGVQVIIGNTVIDGTVRRRLEDLKQKLLTVRV
ncbi:MAG: ATP synthase F1 subunit delta [Candidatus Omnitrophica bacterium]|nr:ATP synthase F1 subunit delta [Candidatus Omnitrophota bacterium]